MGVRNRMRSTKESSEAATSRCSLGLLQVLLAPKGYSHTKASAMLTSVAAVLSSCSHQVAFYVLPYR